MLFKLTNTFGILRLIFAAGSAEAQEFDTGIFVRIFGLIIEM